MLTEESALISNVQGVGGDEEYDMDEYVLRMEKIIKRNLEIYGDLHNRITKIKKLMKKSFRPNCNKINLNFKLL